MSVLGRSGQPQVWRLNDVAGREVGSRIYWKEQDMTTVWKIAPGRRAAVWDDCHDRKCITINWLNQTDYSLFATKEEIKRALIKAQEGKGGGGAISIWRFTREVGQGQVVVANDGLSRVVGIGLITSGYLPSEHSRNPNRKQTYHRHARLVDWLVDEPVDLHKRLFNPPTVHQLEPGQYRVIVQAYLKQHPELKETLDGIFGKQSVVNRFGPASDEADSIDESVYVAPHGDLREKVWHEIKKRRGQGAFRSKLLHRYGGRCLVTGCEVVAVLEAAHIDPYRGEGNNHPGNGLLLRADIHTLFDLNLLGIEPNSLRIQLHPDITEKYGKLVRKTLGCDENRRPLQQALKRRYKLFQKQKQCPA